MRKIVEHHRARGTAAIAAQVLARNAAMLGLARDSGFVMNRGDEPELIECHLGLADGARDARSQAC
jgi:acetyl-CoA synthetase (ADP-forming)